MDARNPDMFCVETQHCPSFLTPDTNLEIGDGMLPAQSEFRSHQLRSYYLGAEGMELESMRKKCAFCCVSLEDVCTLHFLQLNAIGEVKETITWVAAFAWITLLASLVGKLSFSLCGLSTNGILTLSLQMSWLRIAMYWGVRGLCVNEYMTRHQTILSAATVGTISCRFQATSTVGWSFFMTAWELSQHLLGIDHFKVTLNVHGCCWEVDYRFFNILCVCFSFVQMMQRIMFHCARAKTTSKWGDLRPPKLPLEDDERAEKWCLGVFFLSVAVVVVVVAGGGGGVVVGGGGGGGGGGV